MTMSDTVEIEDDELSKLLGGSDTPGGGEDKPAPPDLATIMLPDSEDVPSELRGKPVKDGLTAFQEMQKKLTQALQEKAKLVQTLESAGKVAPPTSAGSDTSAAPPPSPDALGLDVMGAMLLDSQIDRVVAASPELAPFKSEIRQLLDNVSDVRVRFHPQALETAVRHVRGVHFDELVEARMKAKTNPKPPESVVSEAGGNGTPTPGLSVNLDKRAQSIAVGWLGKEGVKRILEGGGA